MEILELFLVGFDFESEICKFEIYDIQTTDLQMFTICMFFSTKEILKSKILENLLVNFEFENYLSRLFCVFTLSSINKIVYNHPYKSAEKLEIKYTKSTNLQNWL